MFTFGRRQFQKSSLEAHRNRLHRVPGASPGQQNWPFTLPRGSSITAGHSDLASTPEFVHNVFTNFLRFCSERSLAVARTPLTVREQTGRSDRSPPGPPLVRRHGPDSSLAARLRKARLAWLCWARRRSRATKAAVSNGAPRLVGRRSRERLRLGGQGGPAGRVRRHL